MEELVQGTEAWLKFREARIGSSDAPIILGVSEYCTPYELWLRKLGRRKSQSSNFATDLGHRWEPALRAHLELKLGLDFPPKMVAHPRYDFIISSLDGYCETTNEIAEFKFAGREVFEEAERGFVHDKYIPQVAQPTAALEIVNPLASRKLRNARPMILASVNRAARRFSR